MSKLLKKKPEVILYYLPGSLCSQKVKLALIEASVDFTELNPKGVVPTLVVDGNPICDSAVSVKYVADELCEHSNGF
eukprot:gene29948-26803_t